MMTFKGLPLANGIMFMNSAIAESSNGNCRRKNVGAVIVAKCGNVWGVIGRGSNQALPGVKSCLQIGCDIAETTSTYTYGKFTACNCIRTVHAEINAIISADAMYNQLGEYYEDFALFTNTFPCWHCFKACVMFGIRGIYYTDSYNPDPKVFEYATEHGIELHDVSSIMQNARKDCTDDPANRSTILAEPTNPTRVGNNTNTT